MNTNAKAAQFAATAKGQAIMKAANGVLAEMVNRGEVANNREAKMSAYGVIFAMILEMA
jgi:hypothetical protein